MTKEQKAQEIQDLTEDLSAVKNLYLTDINGLDALQTTALRRECFKANIRLSVVKNTLLAKAMEASEKNFGDLHDVLKGNTSLMFSEAGNTPAKLIKNFRKKHEKPILKGAYIEEAIYIGDAQIEFLESIKTKEELIGDVITLLQSPSKNVILALQSGGSNLSGILKILSEP
ncbi:MAG: 50S ribosomal protein L10 [Flavobacteriaceae bacterium TMED171]|nr:50S ribosomal protein L10 [Flavobacteriaceae bacterium]OUW32800.1 MAG: 50S ribosomal protein L10 [Flavobacteriaceae bacterium TMED171]